MGILIVTVKGDDTALKVCAALRMAGEAADVWYSSDSLNDAKHTFHVSGGGSRFSVNPFFAHLGAYRSVWVRRIEATTSVPKHIHPHDAPFVAKTLRHYASTLWFGLEQLSSASPELVRWVNPPSSLRTAESKMAQLDAAQRLGFLVPETIISNDAAEIRDFVARHNGEVVRKSLIPFWWNENGRYSSSETSSVTSDDLPSNCTLETYPEIFQARVRKSSELRIFFAGNRVFPFNFAPPKGENERVDWRSYHHLGSSVEIPIALESGFIAKCFGLLEGLNLSTASVEFCFDQDGSPHFLEVNQAGQFLWMEYAGKPVLAAMAEHLAQRTLPDLHRSDLFTHISESRYYTDLKREDDRRIDLVDQYLFKSDE